MGKTLRGLSLVACLALIATGCGSIVDCRDVDGDGHWAGYGCYQPDCDDTDARIHPGHAEIPHDGLDNDCDPTTKDDDLDGDGYLAKVDCDDLTPEVHPGARDVCADGIDQDCDGTDATCACSDVDGDGHHPISCNGDDCDDRDNSVHPGAQEVCGDGIDQDCSGSDLPCTCPDADDDGHHDLACGGTDCNDLDGSIFPEAREVCDDGIDQDCNGADWPCACRDEDGDGFYPVACGGNDCDNTDKDVYPEAPEICGDGIDQDCDGQDLNCSCVDKDGDGYEDADCGGTDCDDAREDINPAADEVACDGLDNDCNVLTPDEFDIDGDLWTTCTGDCNEESIFINPHGPEACDGVDTDCDGQADPHICGGSRDSQCPDLTGTYSSSSACPPIPDQTGFQLAQDGCNLQFDMGTVHCVGTVGSDMKLYIDCADLAASCQAEVSLTTPINLRCGATCFFQLTKTDTLTPCVLHDQPECVVAGQQCGVVGVLGQPETVCVETLAMGRQPGYYCDPTQGIRCENSLCIHNTCAAVCQVDSDCIEIPGTVCQFTPYDDGLGTVGVVPACLPLNPGETICRRNTDCSPLTSCTYQVDLQRVNRICQPMLTLGNESGEPCALDAECAQGMCTCGDGLCGSGDQGVCSEFCVDNADCPPDMKCGFIHIPDGQGMPRPVEACKPSPILCAGHSDCDPGEHCRFRQGPERGTMGAVCESSSAGAGGPDGSPCIVDRSCSSGWCHPGDKYCIGACRSDADCPETGTDFACASDIDCAAEELCLENSCSNRFECAEGVFYFTTGPVSTPTVTTLDVCRPVRRLCSNTMDCRFGESCSIRPNHDATGMETVCTPAGGTGVLGNACDDSGASGCSSSLCLNLGEMNQVIQICSKVCQTDQDCGDAGTFVCRTVRFDIRPGFFDHVPVCVPNGIM